jgi:hypothetical protein
MPVGWEFRREGHDGKDNFGGWALMSIEAGTSLDDGVHLIDAVRQTRAEAADRPDGASEFSALSRNHPSG